MEAGVRRLSTGDITFVNNYDWLSKLSAIEFLRDVGKHFTVNAMIKKDSVATRMASEQGISYTEFSYSLLQSYDFYHLYKTMGATLQIGGSDQWGNLISGVDYIRRVTGESAYALTMQLIVDKATGKKFGKSMGNAVWLDAEKTSPYELYQFWLNTSDESVVDYLKLFTFLSLEEIKEIERIHLENPAARVAQKTLGQEVIKFVHGEGNVLVVETITNLLFGLVNLSSLHSHELAEIKKQAPLTKVSDSMNIIDLLLSAGLADSKREARTFITEGAVAINEQIINDLNSVVSKDSFGELCILRRGKKSRILIEVE